MPINPIAASLVCYLELKYSELLELNRKFPKFLWEPLTRTGYSTLHLLPPNIADPFEEFCSWPNESRDRTFFQMTQRKRAAQIKIISNFNVSNLEKGVINVIKFETVKEFIEKIEELSMTPDCCFTVLYTVSIDTEQESPSPQIIKDVKEFIQYQQSLKLLPSVLINCPTPDWTRFSVSFSKGSEGEFRIRSHKNVYNGGLFEVDDWKEFNGGVTQLYSLKAELSYVIGITGKYGD